MAEKTVYTVSEAQKILGVSEDVVRKLNREGQIKSVYLGRKYYIMKKSFDEWIDDPGRENSQEKEEGITEGAAEMNELRCYTVSDIRKMLGISRVSVYELLKRNEFSYVTAGGKFLISKKSFDNWLDNMPNEPEHVKSL